ncbi:hypothetical protein BDU57DRAFT_508660 [Ampelomyces quisqualis]|uniref:Uncharacterized protein n=1 Tax=Ampelomyces quisqualis TaxID=50730 RepID=A0A6A5QYL5_AMPQU|nr:hypothetical protein BDU57DRAFT_508660 [Ampelomyces quisqualis]
MFRIYNFLLCYSISQQHNTASSSAWKPLRESCHSKIYRSTHRRQYWPSHISSLYPFVALENLPRTHRKIKGHFDHSLDPHESQTVTLSSCSYEDRFMGARETGLESLILDDGADG